jgi:hypothetical protein
MSTHETGEQTLDGLGGTQANSLHDANVQVRTQTMFNSKTFRFPTPTDGQTGPKHAAKWRRIVKWVQITALDPAALPTGASLVVRLVVNGVEKSQSYSLAAGQNHALVAVTGDGNGGANPFGTIEDDEFSGPGVIVEADQTLQAKIITAADALDIEIEPIWRSAYA